MKLLRHSFRLKYFFKRLKNRPFFSRCLRYILYAVTRLLFSTYRLRVEYAPGLKLPIQQQDGIFYFWHQSIISGMYFFSKTKNTGACVVSPSKDGKIAGFICTKLGFNVIYGSSSKGPIELIKKTSSALLHQGRLCIVGDGSRGPAFALQRGITYLAAKTSSPVIFVECRPTWKITFKKSWDQFQVPLPFSKITIVIHQPQSINEV